MSSRKGPPGHGNRPDAMQSASATTGTTPGVKADTHAAPVAPTIDQVVDGIFTRFDSNTDGSLTAAELLAVVDPDGTHAARAAKVAELITKLDTTVDGLLTKVEVTTAVTALDTDGSGTLDRTDRPAVANGIDTPDPMGLLLGHGGRGHGGGDHGGTPPAPQTIAQVVESVFTVVDADASTTISLTELLAVVDLSGTHAERTTNATTLFGKIDANTDGSVTTAELTSFVTALDTDASGTLDRADFAPDSPATPELVGVLLHLIDDHGPCF